MDQKITKQLEEIRSAIAKITQTMATKDDLKSELAKYATKDDLFTLKSELIEEIKDSEAFIVASVDRNKAEKSIVEDLQRRVIKIERKLAA